MSFPFYIIRHHSEECSCSNCGCPLYVGDFVYYVHGDDATYCCPDCIRELQIYLDQHAVSHSQPVDAGDLAN